MASGMNCIFLAVLGISQGNSCRALRRILLIVFMLIKIAKDYGAQYHYLPVIRWYWSNTYDTKHL